MNRCKCILRYILVPKGAHVNRAVVRRRRLGQALISAMLHCSCSLTLMRRPPADDFS